MKKLMCVFLILLPICCLAQSNKTDPTPSETKLSLEDQNALLKASRSVSDAEKVLDAMKEKERQTFLQIVQRNKCDEGISYDLSCLHRQPEKSVAVPPVPDKKK